MSEENTKQEETPEVQAHSVLGLQKVGTDQQDAAQVVATSCSSVVIGTC